MGILYLLKETKALEKKIKSRTYFYHSKTKSWKCSLKLMQNKENKDFTKYTNFLMVKFAAIMLELEFVQKLSE